MSTETGHTQFYGARYCPEEQNITREEWLHKMKEEKGSKIKKKTVKKTSKIEEDKQEKRKAYTCSVCKKKLRRTQGTHI